MGLDLLRLSKSTAVQLLNGFENHLQYQYVNPFEHDLWFGTHGMTGFSRVRNLALNKPATQSSISVWSRSSPEEDARGANNGQIYCPYGFHADWESNPWWQVDLQDQFLVRRVVLYNRQECEDRLKYLSILKSLDGQIWQVILRKQDDSIFFNHRPYVAEMSQDHLARYIRIRLDGVGFLHFSECQVFGEPAGADVQQSYIEDVAPAKQEELESISRENETVDFYIAKHFWASRLRASEHDENILKKVRVPVFCLENEVETHRANVLICDIEGGEVDLLMRSDLGGITKIIIETHYGFAGERETDEMPSRHFRAARHNSSEMIG
jgi:hypothetical protein